MHHLIFKYNKHWSLLAIVWFFLTSPVNADEKLSSYDLYDHQIFVETLRAGNHDASGVNDYFFNVTISALSNTVEDLKKEVKDRSTIKQDLGKFGEITINVLTSWTQDDKAAAASNMAFDIKGDQIRTLISTAMRQFKVGEHEIAILVHIEMFEKEKKFGFWGTDTFVGQTEYYPIPPTKYQVGGRINLKLALTDDKGTDVRLKIIYAKPENTASIPAAEASPSPTTTSGPK